VVQPAKENLLGILGKQENIFGYRPGQDLQTLGRPTKKSQKAPEGGGLKEKKGSKKSTSKPWGMNKSGNKQAKGQ